MADAKGWSFIAGEKGATRVRAYDRGARGIFLESWEQRPPRKRVRQACGHATVSGRKHRRRPWHWPSGATSGPHARQSR
jgi:hypothetical protein